MSRSPTRPASGVYDRNSHVAWKPGLLSVEHALQDRISMDVWQPTRLNRLASTHVCFWKKLISSACDFSPPRVLRVLSPIAVSSRLAASYDKDRDWTFAE